MMDGFVTFFIFLMGMITVSLSVYACVCFNRFRCGLSEDAGSLSGALSWQLMGESVIGLGTLIFSIAEWTGYLAFWSVELKSFVRFVMFLATSITTFHLVKVLKGLGAHNCDSSN